MTRTFVAVYPDTDARAALAACLARLAADVPRGVRWIPPDQAHLTLRFFGDLTDEAVTVATRVVSSITAARPPFTLAWGGLGAFPDWRRPRVIWIGAGTGGAELEALAADFDHGFHAAGLGRADRPFRSHLTLGRCRVGETLDPATIERLRSWPVDLPPSPVTVVRLMASRLERRGAAHHLLSDARLGEGAE